MFEEYDQSRWAYLFDEGLIDEAEAERWAEEVWGSDEIEPEDAAEEYPSGERTTD